jgi:hypothetical protein
MAAFGIKAIQPQDNEHIFGFATARGTADDSLLEVWNGPTNSDLAYTLDKEGQHQSASGSAARPTYSFEADKDTGRYLSGAASMLDVISGTAVGTWTAGKLTLVQLQVDNLNLNGNTLSSTAGTDLLITPLSGQQIVLDGTIVVDAGVVTGATSITSTSFVGTLTGASTATLVTVVDSTDTSSSIAMFDSATGTLAAKTDAGLTYNAVEGMLTATGFTGPLTGLASTSTLASTVVVVDSTDTSSFIAMFDSATGSLAAKTDAGLTYNSGTGTLTAAAFIGPLTGLASTASVATLANTVVVVDSSDTTSFPAFFDSATGSLAIKTDASNLTYNAGTGILTAAGFAGPLVGDVTGDLEGDVTGNSDTATLASTVTVAASGGDTTSHIAMFDSVSGSLAAKTDPGITYNATSNVLTAAGFAGPITGAVTGNADTATLASTVTVAASGGDTSSHIAMFNSATGSLAALTDPGITYNAGTNVLASTFAGNITGNVTGDVTGDLEGDVTGNSDTATLATTVTVAASSNASASVAFFESASGSLGAKTDPGLTYNASSNKLTSAAFIGALEGNADTATLASTVVVADSSDDSSFIAMFDSNTGSLAARTDAGLTYHAGDGMLTATGFTGPLTGNVTGNASGTALTVTQAAQTAITSVGTLTALQVDNLNINGNTLSSTAGTDLLITPLSGQQIVLDGAIVIDAGVVTGATSITSTAFVGDITGDVTGKADTADTLETAREIGGTSFNGSANIAVALSATATALATAREIGGTSFDGTGNIAVGLSTLATTVTVTDNESTNEDNLIAFVAGAATSTGAQNLEMDGTLTYNPSTGKVTATAVDTQTLVVDTTSTLTGAVTASSTVTAAGVATGLRLNASTVADTTNETNPGLVIGRNTTSGDQILYAGINKAGTYSYIGAVRVGVGYNELKIQPNGGIINLAQTTYINDTTNAFATLGLTVNQGAADNEILALKSSDVGHNMTNKAEADTYGAFRKYQATSGGLTVSGLKDADGVAGLALVLEGFLGEAADTTKSAAAVGIVQVETAVTSGDGNVAASASNSNLFVVADNGNARFIFDKEGTAHADDVWTDSVY